MTAGEHPRLLREQGLKAVDIGNDEDIHPPEKRNIIKRKHGLIFRGIQVATLRAFGRSDAHGDKACLTQMPRQRLHPFVLRNLKRMDEKRHHKSIRRQGGQCGIKGGDIAENISARHAGMVNGAYHAVAPASARSAAPPSSGCAAPLSGGGLSVLFRCTWVMLMFFRKFCTNSG